MADYFSYFPKILYDAAGNGNYKVVTNLLNRVVMKQGLKDVAAIFDTVSVQGEMSPEHVAEEYLLGFARGIRHERPDRFQRAHANIRALINQPLGEQLPERTEVMTQRPHDGFCERGEHAERQLAMRRFGRRRALPHKLQQFLPLPERYGQSSNLGDHIDDGIARIYFRLLHHRIEQRVLSRRFIVW